MASDEQQFCLRWNNFPHNFTSQFDSLRNDEDFVDVTLTCEGRRIGAHKLVLSACSPYFRQLFKGNPCRHPIVFMHNVEFRHLKALVQFMYVGEVNIAQTQLPAFLRTAESLQIRGLADSHAKLPDGISRSITAALNGPKVRGREDGLGGSVSMMGQQHHSQQLGESNSNGGEELDHDFQNSHNNNKRLKLAARLPIDGMANSIQAKMERRDFASELLDSSASINPFIGLETTVESVTAANHLTLQGALDAATATSGHSQVDPTTLHDNSLQGDGSVIESVGVKPHSLDPRPCPECGRVYSNISNLRQHIRLIHYPECIACPLCFKPFKNKLYLKRHLISYHELLPPTYMDKRYQYNAQAPVFTYKSQPPDGYLQRHNTSNSSNSSSNSGSNGNSNSNNNNNNNNGNSNGNTGNNGVSSESQLIGQIGAALSGHPQHTHSHAPHHASATGGGTMPVQAVLSSPPQNFYPPADFTTMAPGGPDTQQQDMDMGHPKQQNYSPPVTLDESQQDQPRPANPGSK